MNPHLRQHVNEIDRSFVNHRINQERITEDLVTTIRYKVSDILDYIVQAYPFKNDYGKKLKDTVFFQLDLVLVRRRDLNHTALQCLRREGNIDWFAEPFFGARKLNLSTLLNEYDTYRYDRSHPLSIDCTMFFSVHEDYGGDQEHVGSPAIKDDLSSANDGASPRSRPVSGVRSPPDESDSHEQHYKRARRE